MSAFQYFTIAEYAYTKVNPLMMSMQGKLFISLGFHKSAEGVDLWVHRVDDSGVIHYQLRIRTLDQVDAFVTQLLVEANKASVAA